ncbi:MAG: hypothetical protein EOO06_13295 [Chitinophagaceae bacterium]|nr:MAG: hypothetical protein EOO06_13295 [Chitinophagaceae bacterium]
MPLLILRFLIIVIICCTSTYGQQPYNFKFKTYTASNGLVHNFTKKCLKDSKGFLWIITQHGLSRFDGVNFKNFEHSNSDSTTLPENDLQDIAIDASDNIWLSYKTGLCFYNQAAHTFTVIKNGREPLKSSSVLYDKKRKCIWSISLESYTKIDPYSKALVTTPLLTREAFSPEISPALLDSKDRLWIPYQRSRYHCIDVNSGKQYYHKKRVEPTSFYEDEEHRIWMTTWQHGFTEVVVNDTGHQYILHGSPFLKIAENEYDYISQGVAQSNALTPDSILWVAQNTGGLLMFDKRSKKFIQHFTHDANDKNGIATDYNQSIYCDPTGIIWICTWHGLTKINKREQQFISKEIPWLNNQLYNCVAGIIDDPYDEDIAWLSANGSGITKYNKTTGEILHKYFFYFTGNSFTGLDQNYNWRWTDKFIKDEQNNLWTLTYGGIIKISKGVLTRFPFTDREHKLVYPYAFVRVGPGFIWLGCERGIIKLNTTDGSYDFFEDNQAKRSYAIGDIEPLDASNFLVAGATGIRQFNTITQKFTAFAPLILSRDTTNEIACLSLRRIDNQLYLGTLAGLKVVDLNTGATVFLGKEHGIDKIGHHRLIVDDSKNLWIYTSAGLYKYDPRSKRFEKFTTSDGIYDLSDDAVNMFSYGKYLYIGYRMAVTYFDPMQVNVNTIKANPIITELQVNGKTIGQPLSLFEKNWLKLNYDENEIIVNYTAPDFTNADKITFQYQLQGYDKQWVNAGMRRRITYNNLPPGDYIFKLRAANSSGLWSDKIATLHFSIATPFWKTWWFSSLLVLATCLLAFVLYRSRLKQIKKIYEVRSSISRSLHDEVGATLSSINIYSEVARTKTNDPAVKQLVDKVYDASANAMENMSDIVWYVNPKNDLLENLLVRMREYALPLLEARGINVLFEAGDNIEDLKTTMQQRHNLYLIFKEAINNALKYAQAKNISIVLAKQGNIVSMDIKDDGRGFDVNTNFSGNGITNMLFRAEAIKGTLHINSAPNTGTTVDLRFPIT